MPSSANTRSNSEKGSSYRPDYDVWNPETGAPTRSDNGDNYDTAYNRDNGQDYADSRSNNGSNSSTERGRASNDVATSRSNALNNLRQAENGALNSKEPSYYTGSGRNPELENKKAKGNKKKIGALITILLGIGGIMAFLGASNSLLAPALSAILTSSTQTSYTSYVLRTRYITSNMLSGVGGNATTTGWTGQVKYSKIPQYMRNRLAKYDIEVTGSGSSTMLHWNGEDIDAERFVTMFNENVEFREAYTKAKRGRVANFFDSAADKLFKKLGLSRNIRANIKDTGNADADAIDLHDTLSARFDNDGNSQVSADSKYKDYETEMVDEIGPDNKPTGNKVPEEVEVVGTSKETSSASGSKKDVDMEVANSKAKSFLSKAASVVASLGSAFCTLAKIANTVAIIVAANEVYQSITYFMTQLEGPSKMMAGYGMESGINAQLNTLSTPVASEVPDYTRMTEINLKSYDASNYPDGQEVPMEKQDLAPIQAPILQAILGGSKIPKASAENYSLERALKKIGGAFLFTTTNASICGAIDITTSVISIVSIFAGGIPSFIGNFIARTVSTFAINLAITTVLGFIIPTIARSLFTNIYDTAKGAISGTLTAQGAYAANSRDGRTNSGQGISGQEATLLFNRATNEVLALEAEQDRYTHSPFDITNRNTFFGTIAYSLLPTITSKNTTGIASFIRSATTSLSSIVRNGVSAEGEDSSYGTTTGDCPILDNIGAVGDVFCNPIITTDVTTIDLSPTDEEYTEVISQDMEDCDANGNCTIKEDSDLAHYISYCANRDSPFGVVDQNILNELHGPEDNPFLAAIPLVEDLVTIANAINDMNPENLEWATGQKCVNTGNGITASGEGSAGYKNNSFWNTKAKYYQRYIEDQRILTQMGAYEGSKNPVVAYEEAYEAEHPIDNSYVGYLSRISGLTPENTTTALAFIVYYNFVENYDPTTRIAMTGDTSDHVDGESASAAIASSMIFYEDKSHINNPLETNATKSEYIVYYDLRNRSYIA